MTPTRLIGTCEFCKRDLDMREPGVHQFTSGWVANRLGGGGHGISLPKRELRFAHRYCIEQQTRGLSGQTSLLDSGGGMHAPQSPKAAAGPTNASFNEQGMFDHVCNVCGGGASFGVGVAIKDGALGLWYCRTHLPPPEAA